MNRDFSELKRAEERMNRSQEIAHLGSWELDLINNKLTWSDEVYRIFGLKPQEFGATYDAFLEYVHPDDRDAVNSAYSGSLREGKDYYEIEHRVIRKSTGEIRIVHEKCDHFRDVSGKIIRSVGMVHDITERKTAELALLKAHSTITEIINRVSDAFFAFDKEWNFVYFNQVAKEIGFSNAIIGKSFWEQYPMFKNTLMEEKFRTAMDEQKSNSFEWKGILSERWFNVTTFPSEEGLTVYVQDITNDLDAKYKLKKLIQEKELLLRETHHRVKNNLQLISSLINLQEDFSLVNDPNKAFNSLKNRIASISLLHEHLYKNASLESVDIRTYFLSLLDNLRTYFETEYKKIKFEYSICEGVFDVSTSINIGLILNELVTNAIKYAFNDNSAGSISVKLNRTGDIYELVIQDTGIGLPEGFKLEEITSLGLKIVESLTEQINGKLEISSDRGTLFRIIFKLKIN